jgi:hypothetical protein
MRYKYQGVWTDGNGRRVDSAIVSVYLAGTTTPADVYAASSGGSSVNSVTTDSSGAYEFWVEDSDYNATQKFKITFSKADFQTKTIDSIDIIGTLIKVDTMAQLRLSEGESNQGAMLLGYYAAGDGGGGQFYWDASSTDTDDGGTIIQSTGIATGRWKRLYSNELNVLWFGVDTTGVTDDGTKIQTILDFNLPVNWGNNSVFKSTIGLDIKGTQDFQGSTFNFYVTDVYLFKKEVEGYVSNLNIDGANSDCQYGFWANLEYNITDIERYTNINIENITNTTINAAGMLIYRSTGSTFTQGKFVISNCSVVGITVTGTNIVKGIHFAMNNSSTATDVLIDDCIVTNITPAADGDAIHIANGTYLTETSKVKGIIKNCKVTSSVPMKRGFKTQYNNTVVDSCAVFSYGAVTIGFDAYGDDTTFSNCTFVETTGNTGIGYAIESLRGKILNCNMYSSSSIVENVKLTNATDFLIDGLNIKTAGTKGSVDIGGIEIDGTSNGKIVNSNIISTSNTGSGIFIGNASEVSIDNTVITGFNVPVRSSYSSELIRISRSKLESTTSVGISVIGNTGCRLHINDCDISGIGVGIYSSDQTTNISKLFIYDSRVTTDASGIIAYEDSIISGCTVVCTAGSPTGDGITANNNSKASNNRVENFANGIRYAFSTTAEIANNVAIGCTTPYDSTSYTPFVDHDNYSR